MQLLGTKVCKKYDLGVHNNLFGGTMLSWIDESAVAFVNEVCHCPTMVTLKIEEVLFKSPVKENNLIKIYGQIDRIGGKSITVSVEARKFNVYSHEEAVVCSTRLVFVRLDEEHPHCQARSGEVSRQVLLTGVLARAPIQPN